MKAGVLVLRRSYKFQLKPTAKQQVSLRSMLADHCTLYNAALQERRDAYRHSSKTSIRYGDQSAQLKDIRAFDKQTTEDGGLSRWSFSSQQATLRRLNKAFTAFFERIKKGQTPGYPRFRSVRRFDTVEFPKDGDGVKWNSADRARTSTWTHVYVRGVGHIKVNQHRMVDGIVKTISIKREGTRSHPKWFVILSCEQVPTRPLPATGKAVGVDMATGANGLAYTSDGDRIDNPQPGKRVLPLLQHHQRAAAALAPKPGQRGSRRYRFHQERVAALSAKAARVRRDWHHKVAAALVEEYELIAVEDLATANMTRRPAPKPDPETPGGFLPNRRGQKAGLNRSILDAAWSAFLMILTAKAECAGRELIKVNPAYTSQTCSACQHVDAKARDKKVYACTRPECGLVTDADINAAINIKRAGQAQHSPHQE